MEMLFCMRILPFSRDVNEKRWFFREALFRKGLTTEMVGRTWVSMYRRGPMMVILETMLSFTLLITVSFLLFAMTLSCSGNGVDILPCSLQLDCFNFRQ